MEKITAQHPDSQSLNVVNENIEKLKALFPTILKEGKLDVDELKALLGDYVETNDEYYRFTWAGKAMARQEANKPSTATLRPNKAESKDWDTTENIFIEGDNLEVLKLLQKSYANQIKMIYIDPPYNTGKDFVYKDNYADNLGNYLALTGQTDEEGKKLSTNSDTDGRYHSNWLNMIYPRLKLARNLLKDDGVMFISIDDNEVTNLKKVCEELFGEENVEIYVWDVREDGTMPKTAKNTVRKEHEYIVSVFKSSSYMRLNKYSSFKYASNEEWGNPDNDTRGPWMSANISRGSGVGTGGSKSFVITNPEGIKFDRDWSISEIDYKDLLKDNRIYFANNGYGVPRKKIFQNEKVYSIQSSIFEKLKSSQFGRNEIKSLVKEVSFDYPKPTTLIKRLLQLSCNFNEVAMDFFAGSGTTSHAVMDLNSDDGGTRKFIAIQLPEQLTEDNDALKAGYKTIADITKERISRAGEKIKAEAKEDLFNDGKTLDIGFKAFKLDSSNINAWDGSVENFEQNLFNSESNIKANRSEDDVLYEILLKNGLNLTLPINTKIIADKTVYSVGAGALFVCLADGITTNVAEGIGKWKEELAPITCKVIFKDTGFNDVDKTNSIQILKRHGIIEVNSI